MTKSEIIKGPCFDHLQNPRTEFNYKKELRKVKKAMRCQNFSLGGG